MGNECWCRILICLLAGGIGNLLLKPCPGQLQGRYLPCGCYPSIHGLVHMVEPRLYPHITEKTYILAVSNCLFLRIREASTGGEKSDNYS